MKIISSFSGGRTSAYMTIKLKEKYPDLIVLFANTGQENDETLDFVHKCDIEFKLNVVWLQSVTHYHQKKASTHEIVNFKTADRNGDVFERMIIKYGIPNLTWLHCTRELKTNPIKSWIKENISGRYKMAIGIRNDERNRASKKAKENRLFYPLIEWKIIKFDINDFWERQPFKLNLSDYQGNCKTCFKKSAKKLLLIAKENPEHFDFAKRMESNYAFNGYNLDDNPRVFFRDHKSANDILFDSKYLSDDESEEYLKSMDPDAIQSCSESCEAFSDEQLSF